MKARAREVLRSDEWMNARMGADEEVNLLAAFAAKEVARAEADRDFAIQSHDRMRERAEKAESAIARAVEEERMACAKALCPRCCEDDLEPARKYALPGYILKFWLHKKKGTTTGSDYKCHAWQIWERSQVKGEGS